MPENNFSINHGVMQKINCSLILSDLRKHPSQTRAKLARRTGLTRSTISNLTDELISKNFIREVGYEPSSGGRRGILLELNPYGGSAVALKINSTAIQCVLSNFVGEVLWHKLVPLTSTRIEDVLNIARNLIRQTITRNGDRAPILGIGVGVTGLVSDAGTILYSKFLGWKNVSFRNEWEKEFNVPVSVDNEVSLAALGENHYGRVIEDTHFIFIEVGYGLGAGIVIDGQLYRGRNGYAGEVGYLLFPQCDENGKSFGVSWESMTNIPCLINTVRQYLKEGSPGQLSPENLTFSVILEAIYANDPVANRAMTQLSRHIGIGLASLINIFDITTFILGGELGKQYEPFRDIILEEINRHIVQTSSENIQIHFSTLMPDAVLMGAVAQVFDEILRKPSLNVNL